MPLSVDWDTRKSNNDASSNCTLPTQLTLSDDSDSIVKDKQAESCSSSTKKAQKQEVGRDSRHRHPTRPPLQPSTSLRKVTPVELPNCSSHHNNTINKKGQVMGVAEDVETFVFKIDDHHPLVRSRHRGTSEYVQLNISNHSLSSLKVKQLGTTCAN